MECRFLHDHGDGAVGTPLFPSCYDYAGAVLHAFSAELWRRTTIYLGRQLAMSLGISRAQCAKVIRLEHCKVAEFQRRGLVHFHAVGARRRSRWLATADRCRSARHGLPGINFIGRDRPCPWHCSLGKRSRPTAALSGDERSGRVASYFAKYATKEPAMHPGLLGRNLSVSDLKVGGLPPHIAAMVATAWALGADPLYRDLGLGVTPTALAAAATS